MLNLTLVIKTKGGEKTPKCPRCGYEFETEIEEPSKEPERDFEKIVDTSITFPEYT